MTDYETAVALWQAHKIYSATDMDKYLGSFRVLFAYHSGKIENEAITYLDTLKIFKNRQIVNYTGALLEQQNQKLCYEYLRPKIAAAEPVSVELVRETHRVLTEGTYDQRLTAEHPGEFKKHDYVTGINEVGSPPEDVEGDLTELLEEVNSQGGAAPLKAAAYLHARFEYIHPFADGNGRVGRTLMNYWLMISGHPPLIIYEEDRRDYYAALQQYDEAEELGPFYDFLREQTAKTWCSGHRQ